MSFAQKTAHWVVTPTIRNLKNTARFNSTGNANELENAVKQLMAQSQKRQADKIRNERTAKYLLFTGVTSFVTYKIGYYKESSDKWWNNYYKRFEQNSSV